jgi:AraC-like DNA-binding protein
LKIRAQLKEPAPGRCLNGTTVLRKTRLLDEPGLRVEDVRCAGRRSEWSEPEPSTGYSVVFVRRGCFRRRVDGRESVLDPAVVYFERPDQEQQVAHPHGGGDSCTAFGLAPETAALLFGGDPDLPTEPLFSDPELDLRHRHLVGLSASDDPFELDERDVALLAAVRGRAHPARVASGKPATASARAEAVEAAREVIAAYPGTGLFELARRVAVSPHHLSRIFAQRTGETVSRYRNRIRVRMALERLADGETSLARLAGDLGFADQSHLCRVVRSEVGHSPTQLRERLTADHC